MELIPCFAIQSLTSHNILYKVQNPADYIQDNSQLHYLQPWASPIIPHNHFDLEISICYMFPI